MPRSLRKTLLWQGVGLLLYLAGMVLFLVVAVSVFFAPPRNSLANFAAADAVLVLASVVLIVLGRVVSWKLGGETAVMGSVDAIRGGPDQSKLEELGYRMPPEQSDDGSPESLPDDGEASVRCPECGTGNERGFDYCKNCSGKLPE